MIKIFENSTPKLFDISFTKNGIFQSMYIKAYSEEDVKKWMKDNPGKTYNGYTEIPNDTPLKPSKSLVNLTESNDYPDTYNIDDLLNKVGGSVRVNNIIEDTLRAYPDIHNSDDIIDTVVDITYNMVKSKVSRNQWEEIIEYVW